MNDIDPVFVAAIHERAEGDVHVDALLAGARRRGVRRVRIRRAAIAAGAACAVLAVAITATMLPRPRPAEPPVTTTPTTPASPSPVRSSPSPAAAGDAVRRPETVPGLPALRDGGKIGAGLQLHLDTSDPEATQLFWTSSDGVEVLQVFRGGEESSQPYIAYTVQIRTEDGGFRDSAMEGAKEETLTIDGQPAQLTYTGEQARLRWSLRHDVYAGVDLQFRDAPVTADTVREAVAEIAGRLRIDRVLRCAVPFRLTWAPAGARLESCGASAAAGPAEEVGRHSAWIALHGGGSFSVSAMPVGTDPVQPNATYAGQPVEYGPDGSRITIGGRVYVVEGGTANLGRDQLLRVLTGIRPAAPVADPLAG